VIAVYFPRPTAFTVSRSVGPNDSLVLAVKFEPTDLTEYLNIVLEADFTDGSTENHIASFSGNRISTPVDMLMHLIAEVDKINDIQGISNALDAKLDAALNALGDANQNNDVAAINALEAFISHCQAQSGKKLTVEQAYLLIGEAREILDVLSGA
jgi:hypothetical protein